MRHPSPLLVACPLAALLTLGAGCDGHPLDGTWRDQNATTKLPDAVGGGDLAVDAMLTLNDVVTPKSFDLQLGLSFEGLTDAIHAKGTYATAGGDLTLEFGEFVLDPASDNTVVAMDGFACITQNGFVAGVTVCFPTPQTHAYSLKDGLLSVTIEQSIATAPNTLTLLALEKVE